MWSLFRRPLYLLEPEAAHEFIHFATKALHSVGHRPALRILSGGPWVDVFDTRSSHRLGLAAGFDKNADWLPYLPAFGFGFAEIGTVTPKPQGGNERPRLFRDLKQEALFNRMGFNNLGAALVAKKVAQSKKKLPSHFKVGINVGKNKSTPNETAAQDYALATEPFEGLVDYVTINVSSPNTEGLRDLQTGDALKPILHSTLNVIRKWSDPKPCYVKLAPEISEATLQKLLPILENEGASGFILTNTLAGKHTHEGKEYSGGWSGKPLQEISYDRLVSARKITTKTLISVGGINTAEEASKRIKAGADLLQIYSGWVLNGPSLPWQIRSTLGELLS